MNAFWGGAWAIARGELVRMRLAYLFNLLIVIGVFSAISNVPELMEKQQSFGIYMANLGTLMIFQIIGLGCSRSYTTRYWQTDLFTKRTSFLKAMPIKNGQIVLARLIQIAITMTYMFVLLFGLLALEGSTMPGLQLTGSQFTAFALVWAGYTILASGIYLILELGYSGKVYIVCSTVISVFIVAIIVLLSFVFEISVWHEAAELVHTLGWWAPAASIGVSIAGMAACIKISLHRLRNRDLYL